MNEFMRLQRIPRCEEGWAHKCAIISYFQEEFAYSPLKRCFQFYLLWYFLTTKNIYVEILFFGLIFFRENHIKNWYTVAANATGSQSINKISFNEPKWKKEVNIWWDVSNIKPISYFLLKKCHNERKNSKLISYCSNASAFLPNTVWVKREFTNIFFFFCIYWLSEWKMFYQSWLSIHSH